MRSFIIVAMFAACYMGCNHKSRSHAVAPPTAPVNITTTSVPDGFTASSYSYQLQAEGGTLPYRWSVVSSVLPPGMILRTGGLLTGSPSSSGVYNFTVEVEDASSVTDTWDVTIVVH